MTSKFDATKHTFGMAYRMDISEDVLERVYYPLHVEMEKNGSLVMSGIGGLQDLCYKCHRSPEHDLIPVARLNEVERSADKLTNDLTLDKIEKAINTLNERR